MKNSRIRGGVPLFKNIFKYIFIIKFLILINILAGVNLSALGFGYDMQQLKITGTVTDESGKYPWTHPNSDYFAETLKKYTNSSHHNFSLSGGAKSINYYISFGTTSDNGIYKANSTTFDRYNLRANVDVKLNEYLTIGLNINGSEEDRMNPTSRYEQKLRG